MSEALIVRLSRESYQAYDPALSLVALHEGCVIGHCLFSPCSIRILDEIVDALALGPISVDPAYQKQGIGGRLLAEGHRLGAERGFAFAFLHGHPSYYPRHGYVPCFGFGRLRFQRDALPKPSVVFRHLPVTHDDVAWIEAVHRQEMQRVNFAWSWGGSLSSWSISGVNAQIWWTEDGRRAAYTVSKHASTEGLLLLAEDAALAREVLFHLRPESLEQHPRGWLATHLLDPVWGEATLRPSDAAMAIELEPGALSGYLQALDKDETQLGSTVFPLTFCAC